MGIMIGLDIYPNEIEQEAWVSCFNETLELIKAYPFATLIDVVEDENGQRLILKKTKEEFIEWQGKKQSYWKINGDLESGQLGESFIMYKDLDIYRMTPNKSVFWNKTQGLPYHIPMLAVASLIESRFPFYASVHGDISKRQAQEAVEWANTILEKPISIPVMVNAERLWERITAGFPDDETRRLGAFYELSIRCKDEADYLVSQNFHPNVIKEYISNRIKDFKKPTQIGAKLEIIRSLNTDLPLDVIVEMCCLDHNGPRFDPVEFIRVLSSTGVFIEQRDENKKEEGGKEENFVVSEFWDSMWGRSDTFRHIPVEEGIDVFRNLFPNVTNLEAIVREGVEDLEG